MVEHDFVLCHDRELHVRVWNRNAQNTVICWHGLARTSADFDELGLALAEQGYRVIAPDTLGRGLSQWAQDASEYQISNYLTHVQDLIRHYGISQCDWVGTSMGGLLGLVVASMTDTVTINKLVLNDIGPEVPTSALARIAEYVAEFPEFDRLSAFEDRIRQLYAPFGQRSDQQWRNMAMACGRRNPQGRWTSHYDPKVAVPFDPTKTPADAWSVFAALRCPILLVHGKESDVLTDAIVAEMKCQQPTLQYLPIAGCGHAPGLHRPDHIGPVLAFLTDL
ncbi:alpha/beta fold hydrolase [Reinekea blandensis]|uniref:Predicted hydrolase or acyltransferase n=1 Tax=Reinekea blandensis MED297 TaxID=314283 RepID=A4BDV1_9GAMM|nr:alpha/beta hydrolase [Reinekea blandensis]EAR09710.1 Predicted hydrolase or acyltransferase [Reinekea blandensis MED297]